MGRCLYLSSVQVPDIDSHDAVKPSRLHLKMHTRRIWSSTIYEDNDPFAQLPPRQANRTLFPPSVRLPVSFFACLDRTANSDTGCSNSTSCVGSCAALIIVCDAHTMERRSCTGRSHRAVNSMEHSQGSWVSSFVLRVSLD